MITSEFIFRLEKKKAKYFGTRINELVSGLYVRMSTYIRLYGKNKK